MSPGAFRTKNTPLGAFLMFVQNLILYVAIVVVSYGLKNALKSPKLTKIPLSHYNFSSIHHIFMEFYQNVETIVMNIKVLLLNLEKLWCVSLGDF